MIFVLDGPWLNITTPLSELYLQGLQKYTNYTVKVAGFSNYGIGPFSYPVICTTLQDGNYCLITIQTMITCTGL